jgi:CBS domain-containing protein
MTVREIMTTNVACCNPNTPLQQVARMMVEHDCGEIPVVDANNHVVGVITDRDICCRAVSECLDCNTTTVGQVMTNDVVSVTPNASTDDVCGLMEQHQIRRIVVTDTNGLCCGIVSQADLANKGVGHVDDLLKEISQPTGAASR